MLDWIERYPPSAARPGWMAVPAEPAPAALGAARSFDAAGLAEPSARALLASIEAQAECLADTLEYHLRGNHLLESAITLKLLAACFRGPAVARWERRADARARRRARRAVPARRRPRRALADVPRAARPRAARPRERAARERRAAGAASWSACPASCASSPPCATRTARSRSSTTPPSGSRRSRARSSTTRAARPRDARVRVRLLPRDGLPRLARAGATRSFVDAGPIGPDYLSGARPRRHLLVRAEPRRAARGGGRRHVHLRGGRRAGLGALDARAQHRRDRRRRPVRVLRRLPRRAAGAGRATSSPASPTTACTSPAGTTATAGSRGRPVHHRELELVAPGARSRSGTRSSPRVPHAAVSRVRFPPGARRAARGRRTRPRSRPRA